MTLKSIVWWTSKAKEKLAPEGGGARGNDCSRQIPYIHCLKNRQLRAKGYFWRWDFYLFGGKGWERRERREGKVKQKSDKI